MRRALLALLLLACGDPPTATDAAMLLDAVDEGDVAGLLEFCLFGASVGVTDDDYEVPDDIVEDASRARNLSEKARLFDTGKE